MSLTLIGGGIALAGAGSWLLARRGLSDRSRHLLGLTQADEAAMGAALGVDVGRLFVLGQRLIWGITQADLIRVDLEATSRELIAAFPELFVAHLLVAFTLRSTGKAEEADASLARARALAPAEHPFAYLLPSDDEWACVAPPVALEEVVPGQIWRLGAYFNHGTSPFLELAYATIVRRADGGVVIYNPVALSDEHHAAITAIGEVTHLVVPTKFHSLFITENQARFPAAKTYGVPGHRQNPPSAKLRFDGFLRAGAPLFPGEITEIPIGGHQFEEVALIHRPSRTAILHDMVTACTRDRAHPFWYRLYSFVWGLDDRVGLYSYQPMMWTNLFALRRSLRALLEEDVARVLAVHSPASATAGDGRELLRQNFQWVTQLGVLEHAVLLRDFFGEQPGFLRDFVRYLAAQRGA